MYRVAGVFYEYKTQMDQAQWTKSITIQNFQISEQKEKINILKTCFVGWITSVLFNIFRIMNA